MLSANKNIKYASYKMCSSSFIVTREIRPMFVKTPLIGRCLIFKNISIEATKTFFRKA